MKPNLNRIEIPYEIPRPKPVNVLLLEDNMADAELVSEAVASDDNITLHVIDNGDDAFDFIYRRNTYARAPRPDLVLLDLNLPGKSGREVLKVLKAEAALLDIPVVVVSGAESADDIIEAYSLQANCFITKPAGLEESLQLLRSVMRYWLHIVRLPTPPPENVVIVNTSPEHRA